MILSLDTFLVALYTITDDLYQAANPYPRSKPGSKPIMSDSEVLTLALAAQWLQLPERKLIRYVKIHWQAYFPHLFTQSQFNRRFRALANLTSTLVTQASLQIKDYFHSDYEVLDTVSVPLMKKCRGRQHKLFPPDIAGIGMGGSDREWYYGMKLALAVNSQGLATGFILGPAGSSDRWLAEYLLCYRHNYRGQPVETQDLPLSHKAGYYRKGPSGRIWPKEGAGNPAWGPYLMDLGFTGKWWQQHWQQSYGANCITTDKYTGEDAALSKHQHYSRRQIIETVNEHLSDELGLKRLGARGIQGLLARIAAKLLAFNIGVWLNKFFGRPPFAIASLFNF
jgi:hypothetical protein